MSNDFSAGFWRLADPKISLASMSSIFLGACAAAFDGPLHIGWLALTVFGIFAIEVAKNASGEIFDFDSGTDQAVMREDRSPFSGGKRVLVEHLLTHRQTVCLAAGGYALGIIAGLIVVGHEAGANMKVLSSITGISSSALSRRLDAARCKARRDKGAADLIEMVEKRYQRIAKSQA